MAITFPISEVAQFLSNPEKTAARGRDTEPVKDASRAEAEEELMAQLWAADPGNQGA